MRISHRRRRLRVNHHVSRREKITSVLGAEFLEVKTAPGSMLVHLPWLFEMDQAGADLLSGPSASDQHLTMDDSQRSLFTQGLDYDAMTSPAVATFNVDRHDSTSAVANLLEQIGFTKKTISSPRSGYEFSLDAARAFGFSNASAFNHGGLPEDPWLDPEDESEKPQKPKIKIDRGGYSNAGLGVAAGSSRLTDSRMLGAVPANRSSRAAPNFDAPVSSPSARQLTAPEVSPETVTADNTDFSETTTVTDVGSGAEVTQPETTTSIKAAREINIAKASTPEAATSDFQMVTNVVSRFTEDLAGWTAEEFGGSDEERGTVVSENENAVLREGDSFQVSMRKSFVVPENAGSITFTFEELSFDTTDPDSINDAFEVALFGSDGRSLVHSIDGERSTFFNATEDEPTGTAPGVTFDGRTVTLDISNVFPDTQATLVFQLANNDMDTSTSVRIVNVGLPPSDGPVARNDQFIVDEDSGQTNLDVLANDSAPQPVDITAVSPGSTGGSVSIVDGQFVAYAPAANFFGTEVFNYTITDSISGVSQSATVTVTVNPINDPPTAMDDAFSVTADSPPVVLDVLANDSVTPDVDEVLAIVQVTEASAGGSITINDGLTIEYQPLPGFLGIETFTYTINDGIPSSDSTALVSVTVTDQPFFVEADDVDGSEGEMLDIEAVFTDLNHANIHSATVFWGDGTSSDGLISERANNGTVFAQHIYSDNGSYSYRVEVTDELGNTTDTEATAVIGNLAPEVTAVSDIVVDEGSLLSITIATFEDRGFSTPQSNETFTATIDWGDGSAPVSGTVSVNPGAAGRPTAGTIFGEHTFLDEGLFTATVTVSDDDLGLGPSTFEVEVQNVAPQFLSGSGARGPSGSPLDVVATFSDPGPLDTHSATVIWGDGTSSAGTIESGAVQSSTLR